MTPSASNQEGSLGRNLRRGKEAHAGAHSAAPGRLTLAAASKVDRPKLVLHHVSGLYRRIEMESFFCGEGAEGMEHLPMENKTTMPLLQ